MYDKGKWELYRRIYAESLKCDIENVQPYPIQLDFELNGTCNYRCESCTYRFDSIGEKREEIAFDKYKEIVADGVKRGLYAIRYNYHNEPLLKRDMHQYIRYAKDVGVLDTYLSTNGSLLDEQMTDLLLSSGLDRLQISLDAYTKETYDKLRIGGDFEKVKRNICNFLKARNSVGYALPALRVNFVKQKENMSELQDFCRYWYKDVKVDSVGIQDFIDWMSDKDDYEYENVKFQCSLPFNRLVIRYNGDVLPCCLFHSTGIVIGNIYNSSVEELWNSDKMHELRKQHATKMGWFSNMICRKCVKTVV